MVCESYHNKALRKKDEKLGWAVVIKIVKYKRIKDVDLNPEAYLSKWKSSANQYGLIQNRLLHRPRPISLPNVVLVPKLFRRM